MNEPENQFEDIAQLLRLKRHEQPPPGYLDRLPAQILARIAAEEAVRRASPAWLSWLSGTPARITLGIGAAAAFALTTSLWLPEEAVDSGVGVTAPIAGLPATHDASPEIEPPLGISASALVAGGDATNPLSPVLAPDTAPAGLFNPSGFIGLSNAAPAERATFFAPR
jgi:hypothetical protein